MKKISSKTHFYIKHLCKLVTDKSYRKKTNSIVLLGEKIAKESTDKCKIKSLIVSDKKYLIPSFLKKFKLREENIYFVSKPVMQKIWKMSSCEEIALEIEKPSEQVLKNEKYLVVLDKIKDPGNLGTLIRTAHGLNWDGVIITENSVDPYNDKALRAAKGSTFSIPLFFKKTQDVKKMKNFNFFIADIKGTKINEINFPKPLILVLSSESQGCSSWTSGFTKITIPMKKDIDSLNVAVSGGILLFTMRAL